MVYASDLATFLNQLAPSEWKADWDNVGLLCGSARTPVRRVLVALDPFEEVCQEAAEVGADALVTHHPLIFRPVDAVTDSTAVGRCLLFLAQRGICAMNAHTNLDVAPGGVNDVLAEALGLRNAEVVNPIGTDVQGRPYGLLRAGTIEPMDVPSFLAMVKARLGAPALRYVDGGRPICGVAVGGGACASEMQAAYDAGCDAFVTADVKYNQFRDAFDLGMTLVDAGHFYTEAPVCAVLAEKIRSRFPELTVEISRKNRDCMNFF